MARDPKNWTMLALIVAAGLCLAAPAMAQPTYSITFDGPTIGVPDAFGGVPITEGDILTPAGPPPGTVIPVGAGGLGVVPTFGGFVEVDALSYGLEFFGTPMGVHQWYFSVDEFAVGAPGVPAPSVTTVGAAAATEASADYFNTASGPPPLGPGAGPGVNVGAGDGDGLPIAYGPALNLIEPNAPTPLAVPDPGDNLDALDIDRPPGFPVYFSLDSAFPDPLEAAANTGTAAANGFVGGDVLVQFGGGAPGLYAGAPLLGLDADGAAPDTDDLDALILAENGTAGYQPVTKPYSWNGGTDMLLYSVRRGSAIIGLPDVLFGVPIEEGDILIPVYDVIDGVPMFDGIEGDWDPGIFVAAEVLGLATVRSGTAVGWGIINPAYGADLWADDVNGCDYLFIC
jgi:hypothetical protein